MSLHLLDKIQSKPFLDVLALKFYLSVLNGL